MPARFPDDHWFKCGARLARTGGYTRAQAAAWLREQKVSETDGAIVLQGLMAEHRLLKRDGGALARTGKPLGR